VNKLFVGSLLVFLTIAAVVGYSLSRLKNTHIMISGIILTVELAETPAAQEKGLSTRSSLFVDHGMLFVHEDYWGFG
jgi:hypothetical protein